MTERWSAEAEAILRVGYAKGLSASQMAYEIGGVSRSAVLGKLHRLGLVRKVGVGMRRRPTKRTPDTINNFFTGQPRKRSPKFSSEPLPQPDPVPEQTISLPDLEDHHCRWIYGDVGSSNWGFCGQEREAGSYCAQHTKRAYTGSYVPSRAIQNADVNWKIARAKKLTTEGV